MRPGSLPTESPASIASAQSNSLTFDETIGHHHISNTVRPNGPETNTAVASSVVTG